jgi:predicted DsbA family dithiol-disulfide isomerase
MARFRAALDSEAHAARISADEQAATKAGLNGTPAFIINGYFLSGAQPKAAFVKLIGRVLSEAKLRSR